MSCRRCRVSETELEAKIREPGGQCSMVPAVTCNTLLSALTFQHQERLMKRINHIDGCRVMLGSVGSLTPVARNRAHIKKPALNFSAGTFGVGVSLNGLRHFFRV